LDEFHFLNPFATTVEGVVERVLSISYISKRSEAERAAVRNEVLELFKRHGMNTPETPVSVPYATDLVIGKKLA
jgi:hypothetical protein